MLAQNIFNRSPNGLRTVIKKINVRSLTLATFAVVWMVCDQPQLGDESMMPLLSLSLINVFNIFNPPKLYSLSGNISGK